MNVFWSQSPLTANQVVDLLKASTSWGDKTIRTLISRLVGKGALAFDVIGREYHYYPTLSEAECVRAEAHSFLAKIRSAAIRPLLATFLEADALSEEDIAALKAMLNEKRTSDDEQ